MPKRKRRKSGARTRRLGLWDYSAKAAAIGAKVRRIREALGHGLQETADAIGCTFTVLKAVEEGKVLMPNQLAKRFVYWAWEKKSWRKSPTLVAESFNPDLKPVGRVNVPIYDKDLYLLWKRRAEELSCSQSAIVAEALRYYLMNKPVMTTVKQAVEAADRIRWTTLLEQNPAYLQILEGDVVLAKTVHESNPETPASDDGGPRGLADLQAWNPVHDGPSVAVATRDWVAKLRKV